MLDWDVSDTLVEYDVALARMEQRVADIRDVGANELVWLLEHPPLYTAGTSAKKDDLVDAKRFPVYEAGRGGQYTYHGPGQRIAYVMLDLKRRAGEGKVPDVRAFVQQLETWLIRSLARVGVTGHIRDGRVGVWVETEMGEDKIAALGVRIRRGVTYHGMSLNVSPDLSHFSGIVPCGLRDYGVTSLQKCGVDVSMDEMDALLQQEFETLF